jgi:alpha-glucosidase (family GH31 glycosyl hydrolase)
MMDAEYLDNAKSRIGENDSSFKYAFEQLIRDAEKALQEGPFSVTDKEKLPPSGDKHDYASYSRYWWPDPNTPDGLPYIRKDGETYPGSQSLTESDRPRIGALGLNAETLGLAYYFTGKEKYAKKVAELIRVWFLDEETKMNPNLNHAQCRLGHNTGSRTGVLDGRLMVQALEASLLIGSSSELTDIEYGGLKKWSGEYFEWLTTSELARKEASSKNNHGSYYDVQAMYFALYSDNHQAAKQIAQQLLQKRVLSQIQPDGAMPEELARTRPLFYCIYNLHALFLAANLAEKVDVDIWKANDSNSRLRAALDYLAPYADPQKAWSRSTIKEVDRMEMLMILQMANRAYPDGNYLEKAKKYLHPTLAPDAHSLYIKPSKMNVCLKHFLLITIAWLISFQTFAQNPKAQADATVTAGNARFTVLSPEVIRMEYDNEQKFEDRASFTIINRNTTVPAFEAKNKKGWLVITTDALELRYKKGSGQFSEANLKVSFAMEGVEKSWMPGMENSGNLLGTTRTLDGCDGGNTWDGKPIQLEDGILSRDGWFLLDDSPNFLFDDPEWSWVSETKNVSEQDWYFFAYGHDYKKALKQYTNIAGKIPLPPRYAFGYWWSRYWAYSDREFKELVADFRRYDIPIDVLIIDMDWHLTHGGLKDIKNPQRDPFGEMLGWTGYTWNKALFPEPQKFIEWTDSEKLKTALNLHPASGIAALESQYEDFAKEYGFDTSNKDWIPYKMADKKWASTYFNTVLKPYEDWGVDFWWLDWQQYPTSRVVDGLSNTWWINHTFFSSMPKRTGKRALIFHRWGGLGNHRYQTGFSGDYKISWESLKYQPYFTYTASNVGYGYWSHDIGGHASGDLGSDAELYTRWLQFGIFSPVLRTHSAKISSIERRFWMYPDEFPHMLELLQLRYALAPYTYTMARKAYDDGISLCRPMYYDHPKEKQAYDFKYQYMYGDQMLFSPVYEPVGDDLIVEQELWLPEGNWFQWTTGERFEGGKVVKKNYMLKELPLYIKEGSIIPMYPKISNLQELPNHLILKVFPGEKGSFDLYEDQGDDENYQSDAFAFTPITQSEEGNRKTIVIEPAKGSYEGMPSSRSYEIQLPASFPPSTVKVNGETYPYAVGKSAKTWTYNGQELAASISIPAQSLSRKVEIEISYDEAFLAKKTLLYGKRGAFRRLQEIIGLMKIEIARENWWALLSDRVFAAEQAPVRISYDPNTIVEQLELFEKNYEDIVSDMRMHRDARKEITDNVLVPLERY